MELVYLWVKEYKNIKEQGFNFSPRFDCKFKDNELSIIDKKETGEFYPKNIFPDKINITAIVGENGSGKSSILELIASINLDINKLDNTGYFYVLFDDELKVYSKDIEEIKTEPQIEIEQYFSLEYEDKTGKGRNYNHNVNFNKYFDLCYLNISHLEQDGIIENDIPLQDQKIGYYGIYSTNKFETEENSIHSLFGEFHLSRFNYFQTYAISRLLIDRNYSSLLFDIFKINKPYSFKLSYDMDELTKVHKEVDKDLIKFLKELPNNIIELESKKLEEFFMKCIGNYNIENDIKLTFQTRSGKNIKFSTGEKTILFYLEKIDLMLNKLKDKSAILLFDEIELYLHPNWQRQILKIILDFISTSKLTNLLHIIINSHSPFIISDLPKENIIFLEDGVQKHPFKDKQTFGANIHTLLSDGFFMQDGLMGEFAKEKIEEIKKFYDFIQKYKSKIEKKKNTKERIKKYYLNKKDNFEHIQSIIGEPFLQTVIKNYLDELEIIFNGKKQFLQNEIKRLQELESSL